MFHGVCVITRGCLIVFDQFDHLQAIILQFYYYYYYLLYNVSKFFKKHWAKAGSLKRVQIGGWQDIGSLGREFWVERGSNPSPKGGIIPPVVIQFGLPVYELGFIISINTYKYYTCNI